MSDPSSYGGHSGAGINTSGSDIPRVTSKNLYYEAEYEC